MTAETIPEKYKQYILSDAFSQYCDTLDDYQVQKQISTRKLYYEEEPRSNEYEEISFLADSAQNGIDIEKNCKTLSLTVNSIFVPVNAMFLELPEGEDEYNELDITDYQQKYFKFVTQESDHRWSKRLDTNFTYCKLKYRPDENGTEKASAFVSYQDKL